MSEDLFRRLIADQPLHFFPRGIEHQHRRISRDVEALDQGWSRRDLLQALIISVPTILA